METLKRYGVERLEAQGQPFDPNHHEAVGFIVDGKTPADHVAEVVQTGYMDGERVLRPARVVVSRGEYDKLRIAQSYELRNIRNSVNLKS